MKPDRIHSYPHPVIGLTGGVASGKSSVSNFLRQEGHPIICADEMVHQIYQKPETKDFIQKLAPIVMTDNTIDFKKLREIFFSQQEVKERIEKFIYSQLPGQFALNAKKFSDRNYLIYDVPLLFEKKMEQKFDLIVVVYCPKATQKERLIKRDKISSELVEKMFTSQIDIEEKKNRSDYLIDNTESDESQMQLKQSAKNIFDQIIKGLK